MEVNNFNIFNNIEIYDEVYWIEIFKFFIDIFVRIVMGVFYVY